MQKLIEGVHKFQENIFGSRQALFKRLARGQDPVALFITCSDSRINPNLLTQTEPGDLFILRNAGNIVPPYAPATPGGEAATIEFALRALGVRDIILCGHSHCGAMKGLIDDDPPDDMPAVRSWLAHGDATRRTMRDKYHYLSDDALLTATVEENVLAQLENLRTHPSVSDALAKERLNIHGWVYKIETGQVFDFDPQSGQFLPLGSQARPPAFPAAPNDPKRLI
jgi:carbonic anhydrase